VISGFNNQNLKPVWIIGNPRSGTTLLYNLLANFLNVNYISNFAINFPYAPYLATRLQHLLSLSRNKSYNFNEGDTKSLGAPHESWQFLYRWFPEGYQNHYVSYDQFSSSYFDIMRTEVCALSSIKDGPFMLKNTVNSLRIAPLFKVFPNSLFIVCERNKIDTCQSILRLRRKRKNPNKWVGPAPKEYGKLKSLNIHQQVCGQVYFIDKQIENDKKQFGLHDQFLHINYQQVCLQPEETINQIQEFLSRHEIASKKTSQNLPSFTPNIGKTVSDLDFELIEQNWDYFNRK
jgi:hypothetical protein